MLISDPREKRNGQEPFLVSTMCATITLLCLVTPWSGELQAQVREPETPRAETQKDTTSVDTPILAEDYVIGPDDMLNVYVLDVPELSRDYRVSAAGTLTIPVLANPIDAAGSTLAQLSKLLSQELKTQGLVSDPHITLTVQTIAGAFSSNCWSSEAAAGLSAVDPKHVARHAFSGRGACR